MWRKKSLSSVLAGLSVCLVTVGGGARWTFASELLHSSNAEPEPIASSGLPFITGRAGQGSSFAQWITTNHFLPYQGRLIFRVAALPDGGLGPASNHQDWLWNGRYGSLVLDDDPFHLIPLPPRGGESTFMVLVDPASAQRSSFPNPFLWTRKKPEPLPDPRSKPDQLKPLIIALEDYPNYAPARGAKSDGDALREAFMATTSWAIPKLEPIHRLNGRQLDAEVRSYFTRQANAGDILFFYFGGHGTAEKSAEGREEGYLLPNDFSGQSDLKDALSATELWQYIRYALEERHVERIVVMVDACRSGALQALPFPSFNELDERVAFISSSGATQNSFSCENGSEFTQTFVEAINDPAYIDARVGAVTVEQAYLRASQKLAASYLQMPARRGNGAAFALPLGWPLKNWPKEKLDVPSAKPTNQEGQKIVVMATITPLDSRDIVVAHGREPSAPPMHKMTLSATFGIEADKRVYGILVRFLGKNGSYELFRLCSPDVSADNIHNGDRQWPKKQINPNVVEKTCEFYIPQDVDLASSSPIMVRLCKGTGDYMRCEWKSDVVQLAQIQAGTVMHQGLSNSLGQRFPN